MTAWTGNSAGHARAGALGGKAKRKSDPGNFKADRKRASEAGKRGAKKRWEQANDKELNEST
jgi:general stress protein YciG